MGTPLTPFCLSKRLPGCNANVTPHHLTGHVIGPAVGQWEILEKDISKFTPTISLPPESFHLLGHDVTGKQCYVFVFELFYLI